MLRTFVVVALEDEDYEVDEVAEGKEAVQLLECNTYVLMILDYITGYTGLENIEKIQSSEIKTKGNFDVICKKTTI